MQGLVTEVIDGDTFKLKYYELEIRCRIANINAPEIKGVFGKESYQRLNDLLKNKEIDFEVISKDAHGRFVVIPFLLNEKGERTQRIDEMMISEGYAWHWEKFSENKNLIALQTRAYQEGKGLWAKEIIDKHYCEKCLPIVQERGGL